MTDCNGTGKVEMDFITTKVHKQPVVCPPSLPIVIHCPACGTQHIDEGKWADKPHKSHRCEECGRIFKTANIPTIGVKRLPKEKK
jgi:predicted RNA-binding Zn-ribbon protein involved in translation (DUF1610 family)